MQKVQTFYRDTLQKSDSLLNLFRFNERKVMLWGGFLFMIIGRILYIPWGPDPPKIADYGRKYRNKYNILFRLPLFKFRDIKIILFYSI